MDQKNPFESPMTFRLHRAEYLTGLSCRLFSSSSTLDKFDGLCSSRYSSTLT